MIGINVEALKESRELQDFLKERLGTEVKIEGNIITVGSIEEIISHGKIKDCIERFLYRKKLFDKYKTISDKDELKIIKKKD
ncbi:MAG: hypothetical protein QG670_249 [Thermoproteota archaeon]|nr:hypothetical protein [Thermoproteota archaeon]